jgi:1-acyl-sn-glycerol-3-phosphate acyltransferase
VKPFYRLTRFLLRQFSRAWFHIDSSGVENLPAHGPAIIASNHASNLDPVLLAVTVPRECNFLAKEQLFRVPVFGQVLRALNARPIRREGLDRAALRASAEALRAGGLLVVFPEGTRTRDGGLQEMKAGMFLIARQGGEPPIVPTYIDGSFAAMPRGVSFPRRRKIRVHYGPPIPAQPDKSPDARILEVADAIAALAPQPDLRLL